MSEYQTAQLLHYMRENLSLDVDYIERWLHYIIFTLILMRYHV